MSSLTLIENRRGAKGGNRVATEGAIAIAQVRNGSGSAGGGEEMSQQDLLGLDVGCERRQGGF